MGLLAAALGGEFVSGLFGRSSARKSMRFQKEMAQKAHQYEVEDLRAAGLNPILSGTGGAGARASGGAMPSTPDFGGTAVAAMRAKAEITNIEANTDFTEAKTKAIGGPAEIGEFVGQGLAWAKRELKKAFKLIPNTGKVTAEVALKIYQLKKYIAGLSSTKGGQSGNVRKKTPLEITIYGDEISP